MHDKEKHKDGESSKEPAEEPAAEEEEPVHPLKRFKRTKDSKKSTPKKVCTSLKVIFHSVFSMITESQAATQPPPTTLPNTSPTITLAYPHITSPTTLAQTIERLKAKQFKFTKAYSKAKSKTQPKSQSKSKYYT